MIAILALAAAASVPTPLKEPVPSAPVQGWLAASDYPAEPAGGAAVRVLNFALTIATDGSVIRCTVEGSTGSAALDGKACALLQQRGRFRPALNSAGNPAIGVWRGRALWATAAGTNNYVPPLIEMAVALQAMPGGLADPAYFDIAVSVDATGRADGCVTAVPLDLAGQPIPDKVEAGKILGSTACAQALQRLKLPPAKGADDNPVASVQTARVLFTARPAELAADPRPKGDIVVQGKQEVKGEVKIVPTKGFIRVEDYQAIGYELVAVLTNGGGWYRMELQPPCIGNSRLSKMSKLGVSNNDGAEVMVDQDMIERLPRELRNPLYNAVVDGVRRGPNGGIMLPGSIVVNEGLGFSTHADGSFDSGVEVVATTIDEQDVVHIDSCRIRSLVAGDPPKGFKPSAKKKAR